MSTLYVRDGSRFVPVDDAPPTWLTDVPPIPTPVRVPDDEPEQPQDGRASFVPVSAPKCRHGHFTRWALGFTDKGVPNCPPCHREESRRAR